MIEYGIIWYHMVSLYLHHIECYMFFCNGCVSSPCVLYPTQSRWFSWSRLFSLPNGKWVGSLINESPGFRIYPMYNSCKGGRVGCGWAVCQGNSYHSTEEHPGHPKAHRWEDVTLSVGLEVWNFLEPWSLLVSNFLHLLQSSVSLSFSMWKRDLPRFLLMMRGRCSAATP